MDATLPRLHTFIRTANQRLPLLGPEPPEQRDGEEAIARMQARHAMDPAHSLLQRFPKLAGTIGPFKRQDFSHEFVERIIRGAEGKNILYVSTPITGGLRLYDFLSTKGKKNVRELSPEDMREFASQVIDKNCQAACALADSLRTDETVVVDPSRVSVKSWSQGQYLHHWLDVIRVSSGVVLQDGWQCSEGCVHEARTAFESSIPVWSADGTPLTRERARELVSNTIEALRARGFEPPDLLPVLDRPDGNDEVPEPGMFNQSTPIVRAATRTLEVPAGPLEEAIPRLAKTMAALTDEADACLRAGATKEEMAQLEDSARQRVDQEPEAAIDALEELLSDGAKNLDGAALPARFQDCGNGVFSVRMHKVGQDKAGFLGEEAGMLMVDTTPGRDGLNYYIIPAYDMNEE